MAGTPAGTPPGGGASPGHKQGDQRGHRLGNGGHGRDTGRETAGTKTGAPAGPLLGHRGHGLDTGRDQVGGRRSCRARVRRKPPPPDESRTAYVTRFPSWACPEGKTLHIRCAFAGGARRGGAERPIAHLRVSQDLRRVDFCVDSRCMYSVHACLNHLHCCTACLQLPYSLVSTAFRRHMRYDSPRPERTEMCVCVCMCSRPIRHRHHL